MNLPPYQLMHSMRMPYATRAGGTTQRDQRTCTRTLGPITVWKTQTAPPDRCWVACCLDRLKAEQTHSTFDGLDRKHKLNHDSLILRGANPRGVLDARCISTWSSKPIKLQRCLLTRASVRTQLAMADARRCAVGRGLNPLRSHLTRGEAHTGLTERCSGASSPAKMGLPLTPSACTNTRRASCKCPAHARICSLICTTHKAAFSERGK